MKGVLVPIDGSAAAMRALAHALAELRGVIDARVELLNVQPPLIQPWPDKLVSPQMIDAELRHRGRLLLADAQAAAQTAAVPCELHVRVGSAAEEIVACAAAQHCDAIVMGTRGRGAVAGLVLGSVAQRVVHLATLPVTLVK